MSVLNNEVILAGFDSMNELLVDIESVENKIVEATEIIDNMISIMEDTSVYFGQAKNDLNTYNSHLRGFIMQEAALLGMGASYIILCLQKSMEENVQIRELIESVTEMQINLR